MLENRVLSSFSQGEFVVSAQVDPPTHTPGSGKEAVRTLIEKIRVLEQAGIRLIDVNMSRRFTPDPILLSLLIRSEVPGVNVIPHLAVRDMAPVQIARSILAANQHQDKNLDTFLIVTGDPYETTPAVSKSTSVEAIAEVRSRLGLEAGLLPIALAAAVDQNAHDEKAEKKRLLQKIDAGTDFFMSQPVFNLIQLERLIEFFRASSSLPLLVGIWPLTNLLTIENIAAGKVTGVVIPSEVLQVARHFQDDREGLKRWAMDSSTELILKLKALRSSQGIYLVAPTKNPDELLPIAKRI